VIPGKIITYRINMLKKYHQRKEQRIENGDESGDISESEVSKDGHRIEQVAALACVIDDGTRMWANAQPDGRLAEHRRRPLFNAAKFG